MHSLVIQAAPQESLFFAFLHPFLDPTRSSLTSVLPEVHTAIIDQLEVDLMSY